MHRVKMTADDSAVLDPACADLVNIMLEGLFSAPERFFGVRELRWVRYRVLVVPS